MKLISGIDELASTFRCLVQFTLVMSFAAMSCACASEPGKPITVSVCELVGSPNSYHQQLVRVAGQVKSDGQEITVVTDNKCPQEGIRFRYLPGAEQTQAVKKLDQAIYFTSPPGTQGKNISLVLVGVFFQTSEDGIRHIDVNKISDLTISK